MNAKFLAKALTVIFENPQWRRKLKTIAIVGTLGLFLTGGLVVWAGWSAAKYIVQEAGQMGPLLADGVKAVEGAETAISQAKAPAVGLMASVEKCWINVQSFATNENLIFGSTTGGLYTALISVKDACIASLQPAPPIVNGEKGEVI